MMALVRVLNVLGLDNYTQVLGKIANDLFYSLSVSEVWLQMGLWRVIDITQFRNVLTLGRSRLGLNWRA